MPYGTYDANWVSKMSRAGTGAGAPRSAYAPSAQYNPAQPAPATNWINYLAQPYLSREPETTQNIIEPAPYITAPASVANIAASNDPTTNLINKYAAPLQQQPLQTEGPYSIITSTTDWEEYQKRKNLGETMGTPLFRDYGISPEAKAANEEYRNRVGAIWDRPLSSIPASDILDEQGDWVKVLIKDWGAPGNNGSYWKNTKTGADRWNGPPDQTARRYFM